MNSELEDFLAEHFSGGPYQVESKLHTNGLRQAYRVRGAHGQYVAKISDPERSEATVLRDIGIQNDLCERGLAVPQPRRSLDGRLALPYGSCFLTLQDFIKGQSPRHTGELLTRLGYLLAHLHALPFDASTPVSAFRPAEILAEARRLMLEVEPPEQRARLPELLEAIDRVPSFDHLPLGIIHTDPCPDNLLETSSGQLYLIDWDDGGVSYPLLDVGLVLAHMCSFSLRDRQRTGVPGPEAGPIYRADWAAAFLQAYQSVRPLNEQERALLPQAAQLAFLVYLPIWGTHLLAMDMYERMKLMAEVRLPV